jgi:hypothetical protein
MQGTVRSSSDRGAPRLRSAGPSPHRELDQMKPSFRKDEKDQGGEHADPANAQPGAEAPARERRARHRVADDQKSGQGSLSALSKLQMVERKRAEMRRVGKDVE